MKFFYAFWLFFFVQFGVSAQNFAVKLIADSLSNNANTVVRIDEGVFKVHSKDKCTFSTRIAYTILNKKGDIHSTKYVPYDNKFVFVKSLQGTLYDAQGKKIKELKSADIKDESAISDFSLHEDSRIKIAKLTHYTYPYTVEFVVETEFKSMLYLSDWWFQSDDEMTVEKSSYQIITPKDLPIRYKEHNLTKKAQIEETPTMMTYFWEQNNIKTFTVEPLSRGTQYPYLQVAPQQFDIDGHHVDLQTWQEFGKWRKKLCEGREEIPATTEQEIQALVKDIPSEEEKIRKIYEYMQAKTRYVSIQLGIGGWQPFPASFVDSKGFGDCKALSNYTKSLLKAANINSHYTLIYAGDRVKPIDSKFPDMQFNHAVLCVPLTTKKDTMWLECTSQKEPAGYMGDFTGNRQALLLTDEGGIIANTPKYDKEVNIQNRQLTVKLEADGSAVAKIHNTYQALQEEDRHFYINKSAEEQRAMLLETWELPTFEFDEMKIWRDKNRLPITHEQAQVRIAKLATITGKRMFLQPNLLSKLTYVPPAVDNRKNAVFLSFSYVEQDTVQFTLPENYQVEFKPEKVVYKTVFGEYEATVQVEKNILTYIRRFERNQGEFPKEKYSELIDFYKKILKADAVKIVLVKSGE